MFGYVYLLLETSHDGLTERYKIGISKNNPNLRLKNLSTGNSNKISLLDYYESQQYKKIERWLHRKYKANRTESLNEWFNLTDYDVLNFRADCKKAEDIIKLLLKENHFYR